MKHIVLVGDIVASRNIDNRSGMQARLNNTIQSLNRHQKERLRSPYTITLGDEFQAVFKQATHIFRDAIVLLLNLYPVKIRFSYGIGSIDTPINTRQSIGMDGSAFHNARAGIDALKKTSHLFNVQGMDNVCSRLIRENLYLISHNIESWNKNRLHIFQLFLEGRSVKEIAKHVGISDKGVYKSIDAGALKTIKNLFDETGKILDKDLTAG
ncbi:MAG: hypothetical protein GF313_03985 [Caldithrix sp.]|nr:hypothetical protein [Caldithrix sp.]